MDELPRPSWMDAENDDSHKAEVEPLLFGTGNVTLEDPKGDVEQGSKLAIYGALQNKDNEEEDSDEDEKAERTVITTTSASSSKQSSTPSKKAEPNKKKKPTKVVGKIVITESGKPEFPRRNFCMAAFSFVESLGVMTCLALMGSQALPLIMYPLDELGIANICLKVYISLFCVLFVLIEWDVPIGFLRDASFLQTYLSRGFLYSFIGLSALEEAYSERVADMIAHSKEQFYISWFSLFMQVSSWMMLALGIIYMLFGLCCLKALRDKLKKAEQEKWETYREAMKVYREANP